MGKRKVREVPRKLALEIPESELISLLQSSGKPLHELLNTTELLFDERMKVGLGFMDRNDTPKIWPLMDKQGRVPVTFTPREESTQTIFKKCTLGAVNAGNVSVLITPAADSVVTIHYCALTHDDAADRVSVIDIMNAAASMYISYLAYDATLSANDRLVWPRSVTGINYFGDLNSGFILDDNLAFRAQVASVAVTEVVYVLIVYTYTGAAPTIAYTQPTGAAWTDDWV